MDYIKPLDGLRAIAVLLVIISHWFYESHFLNIYTSFFNGVDIFFLLSGFLITKILLENKLKAETLGTSRKTVLKNFFFRRTLRIFPIYYLTIFILYPLSDSLNIGLKDNFLYFLTHTSNFYFMANGWDGMISHFWSLAVEEQFYLFWPWVVLLTPLKKMPYIFLVTFIIGVVTNFFYTDIFTISCFDGFGAGALLAWIFIFKPQWTTKYNRVFLAIALFGVVCQLLRVLTPLPDILPSRTLTSMVTFWMVIQLVKDKGSFAMAAQRILSFRPLTFVGQISYGIYIYHLILPSFTSLGYNRVNLFLGFNLFNFSNYTIPVVDLIIVILVSYWSWKFIEKPILQFKKYFNYQSEKVILKKKVLTKS